MNFSDFAYKAFAISHLTALEFLSLRLFRFVLLEFMYILRRFLKPICVFLFNFVTKFSTQNRRSL